MQFTRVGAICICLISSVHGGLIPNKQARAIDYVSIDAAAEAVVMPITRAAISNSTGAQPKTPALKAQCAQMKRLLDLVELGSNSTRLAEVETRRNLTTAAVTRLQDEIVNATSRLDTMRSNSTLVTDCEILFAHDKLVQQCHELSHLTYLARLGQNDTALRDIEARRKLSPEQSARLVNETANAATRLTSLTANATLTDMCGVLGAHNKLVSQCRTIDKLQQLSQIMNNATLLDELEARRNLTAAQVTRLQDKAQNATVELATMRSNATLVADCQAMATAAKVAKSEAKTERLIFL